jgi:hypothetical protein
MLVMLACAAGIVIGAAAALAGGVEVHHAQGELAGEATADSVLL